MSSERDLVLSGHTNKQKMFGGFFSPKQKQHYERPRCESKVRLAPEFLEQARGAVHETFESGGNLQFDSNGSLVPREMASGQYSRIVMPRSIVDWHSHPGKCKKDSCALGIPSGADSMNIVIGALGGSNGHFVFTKDGTYAIRVSDWKLNEIWDNTCEILQFLDDIEAQMDALHRQFIRKQFNYPTYVQKWLGLAHQMGFDVTLFPPGEEPWLMIRHNCNGSLLNEPGAQQTLPIEDAVDFKQKARRTCKRRKK